MSVRTRSATELTMAELAPTLGVNSFSATASAAWPAAIACLTNLSTAARLSLGSKDDAML